MANIKNEVMAVPTEETVAPEATSLTNNLTTGEKAGAVAVVGLAAYGTVKLAQGGIKLVKKLIKKAKENRKVEEVAEEVTGIVKKGKARIKKVDKKEETENEVVEN